MREAGEGGAVGDEGAKGMIEEVEEEEGEATQCPEQASTPSFSFFLTNSHGARQVHLLITMIKWIRNSRLSIKNSLSLWRRRMRRRRRSAPSR